jgi:methylglutaconyl-CoA hydratase
MTAPLRRELADGVLTLTLDRPDKRNALSRALIAALHAEIEQADLETGVRVIVLQGAGPDFCAGADLEELLASRDQTLAENEQDALALGHLFLRLRSLPYPVVASVQGRALAGGAGLVAAADLVVAAEDAQFGFPEIKRGFVPAMVMALLRRQVGERVAFELVTTGRTLSAAAARDAGLITEVVAPAELPARTAVLAGELASAPQGAMALTKRLFHQQDGLALAEGIAAGARVNAVARSTEEFRRAVEGFLKR